VATLILVRHGRTPANAEGILAGRAAGVGLDDLGREQADAVAQRLAVLPLARIVTSPLKRTVQTAQALSTAQSSAMAPVRDSGLVECGYGSWTGRSLSSLAREPLWRTVQVQPSAVTFPDGEAMADMMHRAVSTVRRHDAQVSAEHSPTAIWAAVSHGDVIKAIVADALGLHLDAFQRIMVSPASVCVIRYTEHRPFLAHLNDTGSDLSRLIAPPRRRRRKSTSPTKRRADPLASDAPVGGGG
jgi:2,3-bisphosphoglycerate-dependent phosphoglycerate mutase